MAQSQFDLSSPPAEAPGLLRGQGYGFGRYVTRYPLTERTVLRVLADQARERTHATWLTFDSGEELSFGSACRAAAQFANGISATLEPGAHVAMLLGNEPAFVPVLFGTMAAGSTAVPFSPDLPPRALRDVIVRSDARAIVARTDRLGNLKAAGSLGAVEIILAVGEGDTPPHIGDVPVLPLSDFLEGRNATMPMPSPRFDEPALIMFTSGTTGGPKGVVVPHHYFYLYGGTLADSLGRTADDVMTTPLPLFHVAAMQCTVIAALHAGCRVHISAKFSASRFWIEAAEIGATYATLLGPLAALILKRTETAPEHRVETILCVPPPPDHQEFERRFRVKLLWQGYGMTEVYPLPMRPHQDHLPGPADTIGHPAAWIDYGVVDENDALVEPGELGEMVFRSLVPAGMATGYYKDPEATVRAFRNFMFHTGDLATYDATGCLHFRGRMNDRIRRRGENISAAELEAVALAHPDIIEAAAYAVPSELGEDDIKLDLVTRDTNLPLEEIASWLSERVPRFMVPRYLEQRASFPKTGTEKIEKFRLAAEGTTRPGVLDTEDQMRT